MWPQVPQLAGSDERFLQTLPQPVWPLAQQTPLVQFALWHCEALPQDTPLPVWEVHEPALQ
jgi:hypothetical protein